MIFFSDDIMWYPLLGTMTRVLLEFEVSTFKDNDKNRHHHQVATWILSKFKIFNDNARGFTKNGQYQVATYLLSKCRYVWYLPSREDLVPPHSSVLQNVTANCTQKKTWQDIFFRVLCSLDFFCHCANSLEFCCVTNCAREQRLVFQ